MVNKHPLSEVWRPWVTGSHSGRTYYEKYIHDMSLDIFILLLLMSSRYDIFLLKAANHLSIPAQHSLGLHNSLEESKIVKQI
jgi:hypothetical protein